MKNLNLYKIVLVVVSFIILFNNTLLADATYSEESYIKMAYGGEALVSSATSTNLTEVSLNSFGSLSVMVMLILTSILGAFFVRDEFSERLD